MIQLNLVKNKFSLLILLVFVGNVLSTKLHSQHLNETLKTSLTIKARISGIEKDEDGKIYIVGDFKLVNHEVVGSSKRNNIIRLNADRTLDETFQLSDELSEHNIREFKIQNGKIIVISSIQGGFDRLYILNSDGSLDENFTLDENFQRVDKAVFNGNDFFVIGNSSGSKLTKLSASGLLDTEFGLHSLDDGFSSSNLIPIEDNKVLVTGNYNKFDDLDVGPIFRVNSDGTLDQSFNTGSSSIGQLEEVEIAPDGSIYAIGFFTTFNNEATPGGIIKLTNDGVVDDSFNPNITANLISEAPRAIEIDANNGIYLLGRDFSSGSSIKTFRLNSDGTIDDSFAIANMDFDDSNAFQNLELLSDKIAMSSDFNIINDEIRLGIAYLNLSGELLPLVSEFTKEATPTSAVIQPDSKIVVSGDFQFVNGLSNPGIVRLNANGSIDDTFSLGTELALDEFQQNQINSLALQPDGKILIGGRIFNNSFSAVVARLNTDGSLDNTFDDQVSNLVFKVHLLENGQIMAMGRNITNGNGGNLIRLNDDGSIDDSFNTTVFENNDIIKEFKILSDGTYLVGGERSVSGFVFRFNTDGSLVSSFTYDNPVDALAVTSSKWLIAGINTSGGGFLTTPTFVTQTDLEGEIEDQASIAITGITNFGFYRDLLTIDDNTLLVAGFYDFINSQERKGLSKVTTSGAIDDEFIFNLTGWSEKIVPIDDESILVLGPFSQVNGIDRFSIAKIKIVNTPSSISGTIQDLSTNEEETIELSLEDLVIEDPDDELSDMTLTANEGDNYVIDGLSITPALDFNGTLTVPIIVNDGKVDSEVFNLNITVVPVNDVPIITEFSGTVVTAEESVLGISIDDFSITDPDNTFPNDYSLSIADGNNFSTNGSTITPDTDFNGILSISITVNDGTDNSVPFDINIEVTPVNDAPIVTGTVEDLNTNEDETIELSLEDLVIEDPDNELSEIILTINEGDNYTLDGLSITPIQDFNGTLTIPISLNDGEDEGEIFNLSISVLPVNDVPVISAFSGTVITAEESTFDISVDDFSVTDPDNTFPDDFSITVANGDNFSADGSIITPDTDFNGTLTLSITTNDGTDDSEPFEVNIEVTPVNDAPVITGTSLETTVDNETPIVIQLSDLIVTDPDNDFPSDFSLNVGVNDNYTVDGNTITPTPEFIGNIVVPVTVNDGSVDSEPFNITIEVTEVTGIELELVSKKVDIYPNPFEDVLNVTLDNQIFKSLTIRILDSEGKMIFSKQYKKEHEVFQESIVLNGLGTGIYLVELIQGSEFKSVRRIIKN